MQRIGRTQWGWYLALAFAASLLAGCVETRVSSSASASGHNANVQHVVVVFSRIPAGWHADNIAGMLGAHSLQQLGPHLRDRVPVLFTRNGVSARLVEQDEPGGVHVLPGEYALIVRPTSAFYGSRVGEMLWLQADLLDPASGRSIWTSEITIIPRGPGARFDDKVADTIALQMLERLRTDKVIPLAAGPLVDFDGKPTEVSTGLFSGTLAPHDSGFAKLDDVTAVPFLSDKGREGYRSYLDKRYPRAFAIAPNGAWGSATGGTDPQGRAMAGCNNKGHDGCVLYSVDGMVVWRP